MTRSRGLRTIERHGRCPRGQAQPPEYSAWAQMLQRCENKGNPSYCNYGGRGISVCDRWRSFSQFLADVGARPSAKHSIDRINNDGNYEPGNVRWATRSEQNRNHRRLRMLTLNGETHCVVEWAERTGLPERTIRSRLQLGWSALDALTTAVARTGRGAHR